MDIDKIVSRIAELSALIILITISSSIELISLPIHEARNTYDIIPISELHKNDASGIPLLRYQIVTISGKVTVSSQFYLPAYIQDNTAGVAVYDDAFAKDVTIGDSVTISGIVEFYQGLTELKSVTILEKITRAPTVEPQVATCYAIASEGKNAIENYEGELIRINNVTVNTVKWTVSGAGTNYILTDATGACEIRIDMDVNFANTVAPSTLFDVIGVLSQYDTSSPYTTGYQLMPRLLEDIIIKFGPNIISGPVEENITSNSMEISWQTGTPGTSILMYGETTAYEIDTLIAGESATAHRLTMTGLVPATLYHIKVGSKDVTGTNYSADRLVISSSHPTSTGEINVYFTKSVDHSVAFSSENEAHGNYDVVEQFIERITAAKYSIDICFYSWNIESITDALLNAFDNYIRIRFIYDYPDHNPDQYQVTRLKNAGIDVIDNAFGYNDNTIIQHNKFAIFDGQDDLDATDDWVWTGSLNFTNSSEYGINAFENVFEIQDQALAKAFTIEFNEMWGSEGNSANSQLSRFNVRKTDNTPHKFIVNNSPIELYFSPSDKSTSKIIDAIKEADYEIYFSIFAFTRVDIKLAMLDRFSNIEGFRIRGVFDSGLDENTQYYSMSGSGDYPWNPPADVWLHTAYGILHHKYMVLDGEHLDADPVVITGSQNWSSNGENSNDENTLIIHNAAVANQYLQEFAARYHAAGGTGDFLTNVEIGKNENKPGTFLLQQNYPNPFNAYTTINFTADQSGTAILELFDLNGKLVDTILKKNVVPQNYTIRYYASNLSTGMYLYRLTINNHKSQEKKLLIVK